MQYFASYYRQPDDGNAVSVLLQQAYHKRRRMPVLLACVGNKLLNGALADWYYAEGLSLCSRNGENGMEIIVNNFVENLNRILTDRAEIAWSSCAGILCVGRTFLLFRQGEQRISLLNTRNRRPYCHEIIVPQKGSDGPEIQTGTVQSGVAILLATESFHSHIRHKRIEECLDVQELRSQEQTDRRLREIGVYAKEQGGTDMGVILISIR